MNGTASYEELPRAKDGVEYGPKVLALAWTPTVPGFGAAGINLRVCRPGHTTAARFGTYLVTKRRAAEQFARYPVACELHKGGAAAFRL